MASCSKRSIWLKRTNSCDGVSVVFCTILNDTIKAGSSHVGHQDGTGEVIINDIVHLGAYDTGIGIASNANVKLPIVAYMKQRDAKV
jgi:hypothetical protein